MAVKRNEVLTQATWMNLEHVMLKERSQTQRPAIGGFHLYKMSRITNSVVTESRFTVARPE